MLVLSGVRRNFGPRPAVQDLSLRVDAGEVVGLVGANGAGKTTALRLCVGLLRPHAGTVRVADLGPPTLPAARAKIGYAPQDPALYPDLSAREHVELAADLHSLPPSERRSRVDEALALVGLEARADERVRGLSGGMRRRVGLAMALVHRPPLLLLDEVTAGVDPVARAELVEGVRAALGRGAAVLYSTHHLDEVRDLCKRACLLAGGRLVAELGTADMDDETVTHLLRGGSR